MNVVTRSLMATGLAIYAGVHLLQVVRAPGGSPVWLRLAFAATALLAIFLSVVVFVGRGPTIDRPVLGRRVDLLAWMDLSAVLAASSALALAASFTVGFFGVNSSDISLATIGAVVAEVFVLVTWAADRFTGSEWDEVDEPLPRETLRR